MRGRDSEVEGGAHASAKSSSTDLGAGLSRTQWGQSRLIRLLPYLWHHRGTSALALICLIAAKSATVGMPLLLKQIVDRLGVPSELDVIVVPLALVFAYGALRFLNVFFTELRDGIFGKVTEIVAREVGLRVFQQLHRLELEFHLARRTGAISRDVDRGIRGVDVLLRYSLLSILPTVLEIGFVIAILLLQFDGLYALIIGVAVVSYGLFSVLTTNWRTAFVRRANQMDNDTNARAVDSLLNYETVKYFNNEDYEARLYNESLKRWQRAKVKNRLSLAALNIGQALIVAIGMTSVMVLAATEVSEGKISIGDLVMINAFLLQLFVPLGALGFLYREIKSALVDVERLFELIDRQPRIDDAADAIEAPRDMNQIRFDHVDFGYHPDRRILHGLSFSVAAGEKVALVGPSGAGKSTIARLLYRFYDVDGGQISICGHDIRSLSLGSLRRLIGVVPQDTVLFNHTLKHNIAYGRPGASEEEIWEAVANAHLENFVRSLPEGLETRVGERGLKLSGGEKQRIAMARVLLKDPPILLLDEATSSLDSAAESMVMESLERVAQHRTTLMIAHRLSTVVSADRILVLNDGRIVEQGTHQQLLTAGGLYQRLWMLQHRQMDKPE